MGSPDKALAHGCAKCYPDNGANRNSGEASELEVSSQSRSWIEEEDWWVIILAE